MRSLEIPCEKSWRQTFFFPAWVAAVQIEKWKEFPLTADFH